MTSRHMHEPHPLQMQLFQQPTLPRNNSEILYSPKPLNQLMPRTNSDIIQQPKPVPVGQFTGNRHGRVQWNLGSEG